MFILLVCPDINRAMIQGKSLLEHTIYLILGQSVILSLSSLLFLSLSLFIKSNTNPPLPPVSHIRKQYKRPVEVHWSI